MSEKNAISAERATDPNWLTKENVKERTDAELDELERILKKQNSGMESHYGNFMPSIAVDDFRQNEELLRWIRGEKSKRKVS